MATPAPNVLNFTGERFAPEVRGAIWYEHWHRYCVAQPLVTGLSVLDAACGEGYGSYLLAQTAKEVVGIDIAPEAIAHAQSRYVAPNLRYVEGSCTALPLADASVDLVISFETIEHLQQQSEMVAEFRRVLVPSGVLLISSPNPAVYSEKLGVRNEYHVRELTRKELAALLKPAFPQQAWYGQRVIAHSALWAEKPGRNAGPESSLIGLVGDEIRPQDEPAPPMYFVVVCGAKGAKLPGLPSLSLFDDGKQSLYNDYGRALIREKELYWQELDARKIAEDRLGELIAATNDLASLRQEATGLKNRLSVIEDAFDTTKAELETERQFTNALTWEERNARNVAEGRLNELIQHVNNFSSERARAEALANQVTLLQEEVRLGQAALTEERQNQAAVEWEERNSRKIAEERLTELISATNADRQKVTALEWEERNAKNVAEQRLNELLAANQALGLERDKTARLEAELAALENARDVLRADLATTKADLVNEQQARVAAEWEERDASKIGNDRLQELIVTVNALNSEREKSGTLADRITFYEGVLTTAQTDLGEVRSYLSSAYADLESLRGQLTATNGELAKANAEVVALGDAYTSKSNEFNQVEAELAHRRNELEDAHKQLQGAGRELADTYAKIEAAHAEWHKLQAELTAVLAARDAVHAERDAAHAERDAARAERDAAHDQRAAAAIVIGNVVAERDAARAHFEVANAERDAAHAERDAAHAARDAAYAERDAAHAERADAHAQVAAAAIVINDAVTERDAARVHFEAAHAERDAAHAGWNGAFIERNAALAERDAIHANLTAVSAELVAANSVLQATCTELVRTQEAWNTVQAELVATRAELGARYAELNATLSDLQAVTAELESTRGEQIETRAELREANAELSSLRPQFGRALLDIVIFNAELRGAKGDLETAESEIQVRDIMLTEVRSRLSFRETLGGWLRWPLARLKGSLRRSA